MALRFKHLLTEGIAQLSYLAGDDASGTAAVIDPRPDVDIYLELARESGLAITHIFETHIHADFVSGSRELAGRVGGATICVSKEGGARYGFEHQGIGDGDSFEFGSLILKAVHTPGHTPEHMSYIAFDKQHPDAPWGVFTGDSLFVNSAGRPDLLGEDTKEKLADQLYDTLRDFYLRLDDSLIIYPAHGHGSPCGADIGARLSSTIGYERRFNPFLQITDRNEFKRYALSTAPPEPTYYKRMKKINAEGPRVLGGLPRVPALTPAQFQAATQSGRYALIDTRSMLAFGGGHIAGAVNIGAKPLLSVWAGWLLDPERPILLVLESESMLDSVLPLFLRVGYDKFAGYLVGGMSGWINAGLPIETLEELPVHEVQAQADTLTLLDVRSPGEWRGGHLPGAQHFFLGRMVRELPGLDKQAPVATYCASGYRASIAASLLKAAGFKDVRNIPGSWEAWTAARLPVEKPEAPREEARLRHAA